MPCNLFFRKGERGQIRIISNSTLHYVTLNQIQCTSTGLQIIKSGGKFAIKQRKLANYRQLVTQYEQESYKTRYLKGRGQTSYITK
jgi:hypothetical protein